MHLSIEPSDLKPIIAQAVEEAVARVQSDVIAFPDEVYGEVEAARLLKVQRHVLRDERQRGRIKASLVGKRIRYTRADLLEYLKTRRWEAK